MAKELTDLKQGDTKTIKINFGAGVDITGYIFWFTLRTEFADVTPVAQVRSVAGDHVDDEVLNGVAFISMGSDVTKDIPLARYVWDVQRVIPGTPPDVRTLLPTLKFSSDSSENRVAVLAQVTKADT